MYNLFRRLLAVADEIGEVKTAELSDYKGGVIHICGTTDDGNVFTLRFAVEAKDGN